MKGTDHFKRTIYMYLEQRAEEDVAIDGKEPLQRVRLHYLPPAYPMEKACAIGACP